MINGNVTEFVDYIHFGAELIFLFEGEKFFLQGFYENGKYTLYLDRWVPPGEDYIWVCSGDDAFPVNEFLNAKIWNGKSFWEVETQMEWLDA